jgi:hypothetical protein
VISIPLALLLCGALPGAATGLENFDFRTGTLAGWEGEGFYPTTGSGKGPSLRGGVCSSDLGAKGRTAVLHRAFVVPRGTGVIRCTAYAAYGKDCKPTGKLDVALFAAGRRLVPKQIHEDNEWKTVSGVWSRRYGQGREYVWRVAQYTGQTLRLALIDDDDRYGCHVFCSGVEFISTDEFEGREFSQFMVRLAKQQRLGEVFRFDSPHFTALSTADEDFTELRLHNCELLYALFFDHFRRRGFSLHEPYSKMMVAVFHSQAGFEAYLGKKMSPMIVGVYHPGSNRLVVYDIGTNELFVTLKRLRQQQGQKIRSQMHRIRFLETTQREAREFRTGANIGTVMHEVAHQLSFNCGLLNREGDKPIWLAEGLACYCEATQNSTWQGIGEPNAERLAPLAKVLSVHSKLIPLKELITSDAWLHGAKNVTIPIVGYSQSWALFRMLMEERPQELRRYLALIYSRRTPEHRMKDFVQAFGSDLDRLELRHLEYIREQVRLYSPDKPKFGR